MSKLRDFFTQLPTACGADNATAWGWINGKQFDEEASNPESIFADVGQGIPARLDTAFGWAGRDLGKVDAERYGRGLAELVLLADRVNRKGVAELKEEFAMLADVLRAAEPSCPAVSALLTVDEAVTVGLPDSVITPNSSWA
jgi:hypothetical protein